MDKENNIGQEDFILKKIRYYQGSISDFETYWNQKIAQGEAEESPETKNCKNINAELNKAFEIVPVSKGEDKGVEPTSNQNENECGEECPKEKKKEGKFDKKDKENKKGEK